MPNQQNEKTFEPSLRPQTWEDYIGQGKVKSNLKMIIEASQKRGDTLEHVLLYGNSGLGKTSLAHVVAKEIGAGIKICSGPSLERTGDVASLLTNLEEGDILFLDECHRLQKSVLEMLYSAMEEFKLHLVIGKGPMARTMELPLPHFTLIAATTRMALLPAPFRNRFGAIFQLNFYEKPDMEKIVERSAGLLNINANEAAIKAIAERSRSTPRVANRILRRVRDFATIKGTGLLDEDVTTKALEFLEIDEFGLEPDDLKILQTIIKKFSGGPVGIQAIAASVGEEQETILDIYEPYLLQLGFIERTPKGRIATPLAYKHLKITL